MSKRFCILFALAASHGAVAQGYGDSVRLTQIATGLTQPLAVRHAGDGSGRLFIVQQNGVIRWIDGAGALQPDAFFTMASVTTCDVAGIGQVALGFSGVNSSERGLFGLAFHPDFGVDNSHFFVNYTDTRGDTVVARFSANGNGTDYASCRVVLRVDQDFANHNGGDIHFGPDGYLYVGMGDGGSSNDPCNRAQTLNPAGLVSSGGGSGNDCAPDTNFTGLASGNPDSRALLGKMLRIDVDGETTAANAAGLCGRRTGGSGGDLVAFYAIPDAMRGIANPFAGNDPASACDEVWAYGLRNPWRFSFDRTTGDLLIGDVGQGTTEEVDFEPGNDPGARNYGWKTCEGPWITGSRTTWCSVPGAVAPILEFSSQNSTTTNPTNRCSLTGGFRYRGGNGFFDGTYVYGDYCSGEILMARETAPGLWTAEVWSTPNVPFSFGIVGFGEDEAGALYLAKVGGTIYRFDIDMLFRNGFED